jgi:hypothetical protein
MLPAERKQHVQNRILLFPGYARVNNSLVNQKESVRERLQGLRWVNAANRSATWRGQLLFCAKGAHDVNYLWCGLDKREVEEHVFLVLDELEDCDEQTPRLWPRSNESLQ